MLFINIFSPLAAVNDCFILLFLKWVLMYWHKPATSLTLRDPVICVHFCILSKLFCLKGAWLVWRLFWWRLLGVSGLSRAGIPVGLCLFICESSAPQWSLCICGFGLLMLLWLLMRTTLNSPVLTITSGESPRRIFQVELVCVMLPWHW